MCFPSRTYLTRRVGGFFAWLDWRGMAPCSCWLTGWLGHFRFAPKKLGWFFSCALIVDRNLHPSQTEEEVRSCAALHIFVWKHASLPSRIRRILDEPKGSSRDDWGKFHRRGILDELKRPESRPENSLRGKH